MNATLIRSDAKRTLPEGSFVYGLATLVTLTVFAIDAFTPLDIAVAVFYVVVVLLVASSGSSIAVLAATMVVAALTLAGFLIAHDDDYVGGAIARCVLSLLAIGSTSILSLRNLAKTAQLHEQIEMLNLTHDAVVVSDLEGNVTFWNHGAESLYGWNAQQAVGQHFHELTQTRAAVPLDELRAMLMKNGNWAGELQRVRNDGRVVTVMSRVAVWRDAKGAPRAILASNIDVTLQRQMTEELAKQQAELAHATRMTTLGEMAASMAHEVTQPMAAVVTSGDAALRWLNRPAPDVDEVARSIGQMIRSARRANEIVRQIRAMAKKRPTVCSRIALADVVDEAVEMMAPELQRHGVHCDVHRAPENPFVLADNVQLQQVIINLLLNAAQAMDQQDTPRLIVVMTTMLDGQRVQLSIEDTGSGIDTEVRERLFSPFFTTKTNGMGMGLSICRSIMEAHGGSIALDAAAATGTRFLITLPLESASAAQEETAV